MPSAGASASSGGLRPSGVDTEPVTGGPGARRAKPAPPNGGHDMPDTLTLAYFAAKGGQGTTVIAASVALTHAKTGRRTLLIDAAEHHDTYAALGCPEPNRTERRHRGRPEPRPRRHRS